MKRLFFLTRSYGSGNLGGVLIRVKEADFFREAGFDVVVVTPDYDSKENNISADFISIPYDNKKLLVDTIFQNLGLYDDYLDKWVGKAFDILKNIVKPDDLIFATSGSELGMIKLGSKLKEAVNCKYIVNFHDPTDHSTVNGLRRKAKWFAVNRDSSEKKYVSNADLIITSSNTYNALLKKKYPKLESRIRNAYFGYVKEIEIRNTSNKKRNHIKVIYGGIMGKIQAPEILAEAVSSMDNVEAVFIGDYNYYEPIKKYIGNKRMTFIKSMPHAEYLNFIQEEADIGFFSLKGDYWAACVPSKLFEYINLGLPMVASLPDGDAKDIINKNKYGIAVNYNVHDLKDAIQSLSKSDIFTTCRRKIIEEKSRWKFEACFSDVVKWIDQI